MDPINIIIAFNIIATFGANVSSAKKGLKTKITKVKEKPKSYLQTLPVVLSTITLLALILGVFQIGTLAYTNEVQNIRIAGLIIYLIFSWLQIWSFKTLGENYSQEMVILREHFLVTKGPFKIIRHPQYLSQILIDLGAAAAVLSYIILPIAIIEIPFIIMRASFEDKLLLKHFKDSFEEYKKKSGFMIPFIG